MKNIAILEEQVKKLEEKIKAYDYEYYVSGNPTISDSEYDNLIIKLVEFQKGIVQI